MYTYIYIYIYIERERCINANRVQHVEAKEVEAHEARGGRCREGSLNTCMYVCIHIYIYIYIYVYIIRYNMI